MTADPDAHTNRWAAASEAQLRQAAEWPTDVGLIALNEVDSTQDAARRLSASTPAPFWVTAARQTAGRGRRGRAWRAPDGALTASLLLRPVDHRPGVVPAEAATLSFVAALALSDALPAPTALKWPNDVLLQGRKVAGILLEASEERGALSLVVGVGVNLAAAPTWDELAADALAPIALAEVIGAAPTPAAILTALAAAFDRRLATWAAEGFAPIRRDWLARAAGLGQPIEARLPRETLSGRFIDVDAAGALVLETADGVRRIASGDVFLPATAFPVASPLRTEL